MPIIVELYDYGTNLFLKDLPHFWLQTIMDT